MESFKLNRKKQYLQIALNSTLEEAGKIISQLPVSDRIIIEAGTPLIKTYGLNAISRLRNWWAARLVGFQGFPYVVADLKTMDRGRTKQKSNWRLRLVPQPSWRLA
ncbi:MAG: hypothetical protein N2259_02540 [Patescibacteria group bacterium]|nr:hypothetical protein [Patescibacteria group bacterium]